MIQNLISFLGGVYLGRRSLPHRDPHGSLDAHPEEDALARAGLDPNLETMRMEYNRLAVDLARYEKVGLSLVSTFTFLVSATFALGVRFDVNEVFILIPVIGVAALQMLATTNYAYRVREIRLRAIEEEWHERGGMHPVFFSKQVPKYFFDLKPIEYILLPFHGFVGMCVILLLILIGYSTMKGFYFLDPASPIRAKAFLVIIGSFASYCAVSVAWSAYKLQR